jgi:heme exporter protein D
MRPWLASASTFSAFFALVTTALAVFSAVALAAVATSFFGFSMSLQRKQKAKTFHKSKEREQVKHKISSQQKLMIQEGRKVPHLHKEQKAPR